jgi:hypothetical protein
MQGQRPRRPRGRRSGDADEGGIARSIENLQELLYVVIASALALYLVIGIIAGRG